MTLIKNKLMLAMLLGVAAISLILPAFAAVDEDTQSIPDLVDGIPTHFLIAGVAIAGVVLQTYKGMIGKSRKEFDINQMLFTVIVGIGAAVIVVGNAFQHASADMNDSALMIFLIQQVLTIMGAKTVTDIGKKFVKKPTGKPIEFPAFHPLEAGGFGTITGPLGMQTMHDESDLHTTKMQEALKEEVPKID